jgi:hypothetical protein
MWVNNKRTPIHIKKLLQTHLYLDLDVIIWSLYCIFLSQQMFNWVFNPIHRVIV